MIARRFLYAFAIIIVLVIAGAFAYRAYGTDLLRAALVPTAEFTQQRRLATNAWGAKSMWHARPDLPGNPALYLPSGFEPGPTGRAVTFFIHPTSYLDRSAWNAPLDNEDANERARVFLRGQASTFNGVGQVWAPRYRQATFGAFLTGKREAQLALDAAYLDVIAAWDAFLASVPADRPIIVAGHSQGALHLTRLLRERVAGKPIARRIVAAYAVGWPVSVTADIPTFGLPACATASQAGCVLSWQSFAEPADMAQVVDAYDATSERGVARRGTRMLCTNPLTGVPDTQAPATANLGTLVPNANLSDATLVPAKVPARCDADRGFLLIGAPPADIGTYVLPGNNYHVFDYSLFWGSVRADAARRLATFEAAPRR